MAAELKQKVLDLCGLTNLPTPFNFTNPLVIRSPWLWVLLFESRDYVRKHFKTEDGTGGKVVIAFREAVTTVFSRNARPPHLLVPGGEVLAETLVTRFASLGLLYAIIPLSNGENKVDDFIEALNGSVDECKEVIRQLNACFISYNGGDEARYLVAARLAPDVFPPDERDAIRKATTRAEEPRTSNQNQRNGPRNKKRARDSEGGENTSQCRECGKQFVGSWSAHRKSGACKKA